MFINIKKTKAALKRLNMLLTINVTKMLLNIFKETATILIFEYASQGYQKTSHGQLTERQAFFRSFHVTTNYHC